MDLRVYYQRIREVEASIATAYVLVVSLETPDGGRAGVITEVTRSLAARMLVEGKARLASEAEIAQHREEIAESRRAAEQAANAARLQVTLLTESESKALRGLTRPKP